MVSPPEHHGPIIPRQALAVLLERSTTGFLTDVGPLRPVSILAFDNSPYFEVPTRLARSLHSSELWPRQLLGIDTSVTGYQELRSAGIRVVRQQDPTVGPPSLAIEQGICADSAEVIQNLPHIRDGVYGAPLVALEDSTRTLGSMVVSLDLLFRRYQRICNTPTVLRRPTSHPHPQRLASCEQIRSGCMSMKRAKEWGNAVVVCIHYSFTVGKTCTSPLLQECCCFLTSSYVVILPGYHVQYTGGV
jgi:hypothetical protein